MKIQYPSGLRSEYIDRNPTHVPIYYSGSGVAPHGSTIRMDYAIPSGKRAFMLAGTSMVRRMGAAGAVGIVSAIIGCSVGANQVTLLRTTFIDNTLYKQEVAEGYFGFFLNAADVVHIITSDTSTGGNVDYEVSFGVIVFDA